MGLRQEFKNFKRKQELKAVVKEYFEELGITIDDLLKLKDYKSQIVVSDEDKKKIVENAQTKMTPEKLVEYFSQGMEEFYPDGKPNNQ